MATLSEYRLTNTGEEVQKAIDDALTTLPMRINLKVNTADVLTKTNATPYTPTENYHPATKAYADSVRPSVSIGSTTTGAEGTNALVTNSGTDKNPILNFTIPRGNTGAAAGFGTPTSSISTLAPGSQATLSVTASGAATAKVFNFAFGIPRGDKGEKGDNGISAGIGTPTVQTTTLTPGSQATASVTATGADTAKVFNFKFGLPQGEKGDTGNSGVYIGGTEPLDINQNVWISPQATGSNILRVRQNNSWYGIASIQGEQGVAAGFGTPTTSVTTLNPGSKATATVTASGANTSKIFNFAFGIPQGEKGDTGAAAGFGTPTATANTLAAGSSATASVSASGSDTSKVFGFTFGIPKGDKGDTGAAAGFGTPTATATTLTSGSDATVSVTASGSNTSKVFNFTFGIPKGAKGDTGNTGYHVGSVTRTSGTGASGTTDTYTMYLNDPQKTSIGTFDVYNGKNGTGSGTVLSVGMTSSDSSLTITGSPITSTGSFAVSHKNTITAKTSQALYPITFDKNGHINGAGTALYFTIE